MSPRTPPPAPPQPRWCSMCGAQDYRKCPCPWHLPFEDWPAGQIARVKVRAQGPPRE